MKDVAAKRKKLLLFDIKLRKYCIVSYESSEARLASFSVVRTSKSMKFALNLLNLCGLFSRILVPSDLTMDLKQQENTFYSELSSG